MKKELFDSYKDEEKATEAFKKYRISKQITCKRCGGKNHYWMESKKQFQCKNCRFRTTLKSGTLLEGSKLPIHYLFIGIILVWNKGDGTDIVEFQKYTEHKYFEPLWDYLQRIKSFQKEKPEELKSIFEMYKNTFKN
jgi:Transposase zinc-ribbon domain